MSNHYNNFSRNQKISIVQSMKSLVAKFLQSYGWDLSVYEDDEELLNDLYFYWLRTSATNKYIWCSEYDDSLLSNEFSVEMKSRLKIYLYRSLFTKRKQNK